MNNGHKPVGILAIQGDFAMHAKMLDAMAAPWKLVKHAADLEAVSGLIMPGGESTTMLKLFALEGMGAAIKEFAAQGKADLRHLRGRDIIGEGSIEPAAGEAGSDRHRH